MSTSFRIVTVTSNTCHPFFIEYFTRSCEIHQLDLIVLEYNHLFFTNRLKDLLLFQYLETIPESTVILFSDANDAMFLSGEDEILEKFYKFNSHLVFSAEINCWPDTEFERAYEPSSSHFKYLNSGGFIGEAGAIKRIYQKYPILTTGCNKSYEWSNQYYWHHVFENDRDLICIDNDCQIFYNTSTRIDDMYKFQASLKSTRQTALLVSLEKERLNMELSYENNRIRNMITNSLPCHLHFPGPISKILLKEGCFKKLTQNY